MAQIRKVEIKRFKRIANLELELGSTTLVIGANNAGKSSVLQAIHFAVSLAQSAKRVGGGNWRNDKYELRQPGIGCNDHIHGRAIGLR